MGLVRFLLAISVAVWHSPTQGQLSGINLLNGITAVQAFYVISGFLITMVLVEKPEYRSVAGFYVSRYLRLWPTYIIVVLLVMYTWPKQYFHDAVNVGWASVFILFTQFTLFFQEWTLFLGLTPDGGLAAVANFWNLSPEARVDRFMPVPQAWTIGVEIAFYMVAPFFCRRWQTLIGLFAIGLTIRLTISSLELPADPWMYRFAPAEMMLFALGGLAFFVGRGMQNVSLPVRRPLGWVALATILALIVGRDWIYQVPTFASWLKWFSVTIYLGDPVFIGMVAVACPLLFYGLRSKLDAFVGELSYPIYITHIFVGGQQGIIADPFRWDNWLYVLVLVAFSVALYLIVERPMDRVRHRLAKTINGMRRAKAPYSIAY